MLSLSIQFHVGGVSLLFTHIVTTTTTSINHITVFIIFTQIVIMKVRFYCLPDLFVSTAAVTTSTAVPWDVVSPQPSPSISCGISGMYTIAMVHYYSAIQWQKNFLWCQMNIQNEWRKLACYISQLMIQKYVDKVIQEICSVLAK